MAIARKLTENSAMAQRPATPDLLRERLRELIERMQTDPTRLSRQIGRSKDYIRDFLDGRKESINTFAVEAIERVAELEKGDLLSVAPKEPDEKISSNFGKKRGYHSEYVEPVPIYLHPSREIIGTGSIYVESGIEKIDRPRQLQHDAGSYAVLVEGEAMAPAYEPGDIIYVSTKVGIRRGCDAIIYRIAVDVTDAEIRRDMDPPIAMLVRVVAIKPDEITVRQFNPDLESVLSRAEWSGIRRIVGKWNRR